MNVWFNDLVVSARPSNLWDLGLLIFSGRLVMELGRRLGLSRVWCGVDPQVANNNSAGMRFALQKLGKLIGRGQQKIAAIRWTRSQG